MKRGTRLRISLRDKIKQTGCRIGKWKTPGPNPTEPVSADSDIRRLGIFRAASYYGNGGRGDK